MSCLGLFNMSKHTHLHYRSSVQAIMKWNSIVLKVWFLLSVEFSLQSIWKQGTDCIQHSSTTDNFQHATNGGFRSCPLIFEVSTETEASLVQPCPWHWQAAAGSLTRWMDDSDSMTLHSTPQHKGCLCVWWWITRHSLSVVSDTMKSKDVRVFDNSE